MAKERVTITSGGESIETDMETIKALGQGINLTLLRKSMSELEAACVVKNETSETFKNLVQVAALQAGVLPGVLSQYIQARVTDTVKKKSRSAEQLSLLFSEIG